MVTMPSPENLPACAKHPLTYARILIMTGLVVIRP